MISEINELALGIDLGPVNSQLTFYNRQNSGPRTVSVVPGEENYQIATPAELFSLMEQRLEEGVAAGGLFRSVPGASGHRRKAGFYPGCGDDAENEAPGPTASAQPLSGWAFRRIMYFFRITGRVSTGIC